MDIRVLRYFLAIAREESISRAAEVLHVTQPTLSRQIKDLEDELGATLMTRGSRNITLTTDGMHLRRRAQEIVDLADRTQTEFAEKDTEIAGDVYVGGGETQVMRRFADIAVKIRNEHPGIRINLFSGNADDVTERLDNGLLDFGILIEPSDLKKYEHIRVPGRDTWGLLMRKDSPLAAKNAIVADDLNDIPMMVSRQSFVSREMADWMGVNFDHLNIVGTYNLIFNVALMIEAGIGYALCLDKLVPCCEGSALCFRPFYPTLEARLNMVWKKYQLFSPAAELFLKMVQDEFGVPDEYPELSDK